MRVYLVALQGVIGLVLPCQAPLPRLYTARANAVGRLARWGIEQVGSGQGGHVDVQIDAIEQRAAEPALVARHLIGRAAARPWRAAQHRAQVTTRTRVHGRHQLEARREIRPPRGPRDGDVSGFQRLAQGF